MTTTDTKTANNPSNSASTIWQEKIQRIFNTKPKGEEELFLDIVSMMIYSNNSDDTSTLYREVGLESFVKLLGLVGGRTIELPTQEELKHGIISALCFYYKNLQHKSWEEIHNLLPFNDVNAVSYGIAISKLENEIKNKIKNNFEEIENRNKNAIDTLRSYI